MGCKLKLDEGIKVRDPSELQRMFEDLWMKVVDHFGYLPPTELVVEKEKEVYFCKLYLKDKNICERKKCPAYQP